VPLLLDGNNLMHRLPAGSRDRRSVRNRALDLVRRQQVTITVVFDGPPPPGFPERERLGRVTILYSGKRSADDVIVDLLPPGSRAADWTVITDDRELTRRVKERGARTRALGSWIAARRGPDRASGTSPHEPRMSPNELAEWEAFFARGRGRNGDT